MDIYDHNAALKETLSMEDLLDDFGGFYLGGKVEGFTTP